MHRLEYKILLINCISPHNILKQPIIECIASFALVIGLSASSVTTHNQYDTMGSITFIDKYTKEKMAQNDNNLIWVDMEMTGLNTDSDRIIEVALVITDSQLNTIVEGPVLVVHQPDEILDGMD